MARLNPARRRALMQLKALNALKKAINPAMVAQEGHMRSSQKAILPSSVKPPRDPLWESTGKAKRSTVKRWSATK
jgi:hypothetical protein